MQNNNSSQNPDQAPINTTPEAVTSFQIDVPQLPLRRLNPDVPGMYMIGMDEMFASPFDYLARALGLFWDRSAYHGANPLETGATEDGFTLWPEGHAYDRKLGKIYSREQMLALAEKKGISPSMQWTLHKIKDFHRGMEIPSLSGPFKAASLPPFPWETAQIWTYSDENGVELFQVGRYDTPKGKRISQRCRTQNGGKMDNVRRVLYKLRDVQKAQIVLFVEGEKAADILNGRLAAAGKFGEMVATTTSMGSDNVRKTEFGDAVVAKTVVIFPDKDTAGERYGNSVCEMCAAAAAVKRVTLPGLPEQGDIADYFAADGTIEEVLSLIESAGPWSPLEGSKDGPTVVEPERAQSAPTLGTAPEAAAPEAAASGESASGESAQPSAANAAPSGAAKRFPLYSLQQIYMWPDPTWLIKDFLVQKTTSLLTAKQASYKSFLALSMGLCVALGKDWFGHKVEQGNVLFIAAEGAAGVKKRAAAWFQYHGIQELPTNFLVHPAPIQVGNVSDVKDLVREMADLKPSLIIVDTLARCAAGLDENTVRDMGQFITGIDLLSKALNCHVLVVHHNNKTGAYRGSSSLPAAVDAHFSLERKGNDVTLTTEKQKDAAEAPVMSFEVKPVFFQFPNRPGAEMDSIVLVRTDTVSETTASRLTPLERRSLEVLFDVFLSEGASATEWERACKSSGIENTTHRRTRAKLLGRGLVYIEDKGGKMINYSQYKGLIPAERTKARFYPTPGVATPYNAEEKASPSHNSGPAATNGQATERATTEQASGDRRPDGVAASSSSSAGVDLEEFLNSDLERLNQGV